jgi:outer membrane autotransporter protein
MAGSSGSMLRLAAVVGHLEDEERSAKSDVWITGFGQFAGLDQADGFSDFDTRMGGVLAGLDHDFGRHFVAGLSAGYSSTDLDYELGRGIAEVDAFSGSMYGSFFSKYGYVETVLSYARQNYENRRQILVGTVERNAASEHVANVFAGSLGIGYRFDVRRVGLEPFTNLHYTMIDEAGFQEMGAGSVSLDVDGRTTHSLISEVGARVSQAFEPDFGTVVPYVGAAWRYDFDVGDRRILSGFVGAPGTSVVIDAPSLGRSAGMPGAGVIFLRDGWSASIDYLGEFRSGYSGHAISGSVGFAF